MAGRAGTLHENEPDFRETVGRLLDRTDYGRTPVQPAFDPQVHKDFRDECVRGRKEEAYVQSLEANGFRYWPDAELARRGLFPTGQGIWRHPERRYELAFTGDDLLAMFPTPEAFDRWVKAHKKGRDLQDELARRTPAERREARIVLARE